jgi:hypothetical protein
MPKNDPAKSTRDPELARLKETLRIEDIALRYGYVRDPQKSSQASPVLRHPDGHEIIISTADHDVFFSRNGKGRGEGSVLDFVMEREGCTFREAVQILQSLSPALPFPTASRAAPPAPPFDRGALLAAWNGFAPYRGGYLESRGLSAATIAAAADRIRTDDRRNVVFRHDDRDGLAGWEVKNRGFTGFAKGGNKALFYARAGIEAHAPPPRLVIAESALDALSFWQIDPAPALLLSFAGGISRDRQEPLLRHVLTKYPAAEVVTATDNDAQGDDYAATVEAIRPDAIRARPPVGNDWNDTLTQRDGRDPGPRMP